MKTPLKLFVGLGIPYGAVIGALPWVASTDYPIFGMPFTYVWIFCCFVLTSACLYACWFLFDRELEAAD